MTAPYEEFGLPLGHYALGEVIYYEITVNGATGQLDVVVNDHRATYAPPINLKDRFYFKAGNYNQCNGECNATDYAETHFYAFNVTHATS